ncbi:MAG TPA: two-component system response regulator [Nitrospiraceae bacterium]|nr:two-component system response regulator [Nitrospiraceae bacterium]
MTDLKRILLVEDDPHDVELTFACLAEYNLADEVAVAKDGEEALDYLYRRGKFAGIANRNPSVVLLDLKLPKVGGLEVLRQVKTDETLKMVPVVILTSSQEDRDMVEGYRLGTNAYVVKPVDFNKFVAAIKCIVTFWAVVNEPPPSSIHRRN